MEPRIAFFTFGRYQPPTLGHGIVFKEIASLASKASGDAFVFVGSNMARAWNSEGKQENPLTVDEKLEIMQDIDRKRLYGENPITFVNTETCSPLKAEPTVCRTPFAIVEALQSAGYTELRLYVGVDRVARFTYMFSEKPALPVTVFPIGVDRSTEEESSGATLSHISGTKIRKAARDNKRALFEGGTGLTGALADTYIDIIASRTAESKKKGGRRTSTRRRGRRLKRKSIRK